MFDAYAYSFSINDTLFPPAKFGTFGEVATPVVLILTSVAGAISIILIIISGIKIVTSGGDPKQLGAAQATLTYAIIGLAITILAFIIMAAVQKFLGSNVTV
ncbi:hypothetical protein A2165_00205 [Candidatus Curtissbacteria bacterium RBG_13_40_7]|uniref:Uncharacterized protein n=1 Tax=Candidatus Curtissbacteria bacterium RBG_13_40_7 TaxID=1797706 RepID=A0A1F5FWB0_9BACT|nr:MAG: hypothetical protein A2165_00205 [Candidatus Curtissbacteria bacterium RBG_13_40_7]